MRKGVKGWLRVLAPVVASICGLVMLRLLGPDVVDQQQLRELLAPFGKAAPVAFIGALAIRPLTLLPGNLFAAVGGMVFGTLPGTYLIVQFGSGLAQGRTWTTVASAIGLVVSLVLGAVLGRRVYREINSAPPVEEEPEALAPLRGEVVLSRKDGLPSPS